MTVLIERVKCYFDPNSHSPKKILLITEYFLEDRIADRGIEIRQSFRIYDEDDLEVNIMIGENYRLTAEKLRAFADQLEEIEKLTEEDLLTYPDEKVRLKMKEILERNPK